MPNKKQLIIALAILPAILCVKVISYFPEFVERFYSNGLYVLTSKASRFCLGWIPFSFGDIVYIISIIFCIKWLIKNRRLLITKPLHWLTHVFSVISIIYIAFNLFWGLNYYRLPLHKKLNLNDGYTTENLIQVTKKLIQKANTIHLSITNNDTVKVIMPYTKKEMLQKTPTGYVALEKKFPYLKYQPSSIKSSLLSLPLTYMGSSGYLNPLTNEAQVDYLIPAYKYPTTTSHEVAHQLGYAAENEANFIGFLAAINNEDIYFNYSGYIFAVRYCINEIYNRDKNEYQAIKKLINKGILKNYQESRVFWERYQNPLEPYFKSLYTSYLKANKQDKGIESYSYVVALLVNYFNTKNL